MALLTISMTEIPEGVSVDCDMQGLQQALNGKPKDETITLRAAALESIATALATLGEVLEANPDFTFELLREAIANLEPDAGSTKLPRGPGGSC